MKNWFKKLGSKAAAKVALKAAQVALQLNKAGVVQIKELDHKAVQISIGAIELTTGKDVDGDGQLAGMGAGADPGYTPLSPPVWLGVGEPASPGSSPIAASAAELVRQSFEDAPAGRPWSFEDASHLANGMAVPVQKNVDEGAKPRS